MWVYKYNRLICFELVKEDYITFIEGEDNTTKELGLDIIEAGQSITKTAYLHGASISGSRIVSLNVSKT